MLLQPIFRIFLLLAIQICDGPCSTKAHDYPALVMRGLSAEKIIGYPEAIELQILTSGKPVV
jgi:hypothetical protein